MFFDSYSIYLKTDKFQFIGLRIISIPHTSAFYRKSKSLNGKFPFSE